MSLALVHDVGSFASIELFSASDTLFSEMKKRLGSIESEGMSHSELESDLSEQGNTLLRQLMQDHLDLRRIKEEERGWTEHMGSDEESRTHHRTGRRQLMTLFGDVSVERSGYGGRGISSLHPMDSSLNLPKEKYSFGLRKRVAMEVARGSYDDATEMINSTTGASIHKRQVEELAQRAAQDFDAFYRKREIRKDTELAAIENERATSSTAFVGDDLLILTADGKGIVMQEQDLRDATKKAAKERAAQLRHEGPKTTTSTKRRSRKRMAEVASVYNIKPFVRAAEDIVRDLRSPDVPLPVRPRPTNKRVWAHVDRPADSVIGELFEEAQRRDPMGLQTTVALVDGNQGQIASIRKKADALGIEVTLIVDVIHVLGYLWTAAAAFEGAGTKETQSWVTARLTSLLQGSHPGHVAAGIKRSATLRKIKGKKRKDIDSCANYIANHADYLHYADYLSKGFPIATGVIEGACRHLVKDRMEITGARWRLTGAEVMLRLRALKVSHDFEEYWSFHEKQEYQRNHDDKYAGPPPQLNPTRPKPSKPKMKLIP